MESLTDSGIYVPSPSPSQKWIIMKDYPSFEVPVGLNEAFVEMYYSSTVLFSQSYFFFKKCILFYFDFLFY